MVNSQNWPQLIYGDWEGVPDATPLGPFASTQTVPWKIRPLSNGGFIMWDNMTQNLITNSTQQFYAIGSTLYYCGWLYNFFSTSKVAPIMVPFQLQVVSADSIVWCDSPSCSGFRWELQVTQSTLTMHVMLYPPVDHLKVTFNRVNSNSTVIQFSGDVPDCSSIPIPSDSSCPYKDLRPVDEVKRKTPDHLQAYDHCYQLNDAVEYKIYWTLTLPDSLSVAISVPSSSEAANWIAIGFGSTFPGMNTSDIVLGYNTPTGSCVRSMTASNYVGAPQDSNLVPLTNTAITYSNGILSLQFNRKTTDGNNPIPLNPPDMPPGYCLIWAIGVNVLNSCSNDQAYHSSTRGYRIINIMNPSLTLDEYRKC